MFSCIRVTSGMPAILACIAMGTAMADTHYVSPDGGHVSPFTNGWAAASTDIQAAVNAAAAGDTVLVSNGNYVLSSQITVGDRIVRRFTGDPADVRVDGNHVVRCFYLNHSNAFLADVTVTNGYLTAPSSDGGGIYMVGGTVSNCHIINCRSIRGAGGVRADGGTIHDCRIASNLGENNAGGCDLRGNAVLNHCLVSGNTGSNGYGGINIASDSPRIINCIITGNVASSSSYAGGIGIPSAPLYPVISNCLILNNSSGYGGGLSICRPNSNQNVKVYNCLFAGNAAAIRGGGIIYAGNVANMHFGEIHNCTFASNAAPIGGGVHQWAVIPYSFTACNTIIYSNANTDCNLDQAFMTNCCAPGLAGNNNITNYPGFVDPAGGDYRLADGSPCINTGLNEAWMAGGLDLDGRARLDRFSGRVDIGCYEHVLRGTMFRFK